MSHFPAGRLRALVLAFVALATVVVGPATLATAASGSLPDAGRTGSLTIYKTTANDDPTGLPHDGTAVPAGSLPGAPIAGVTFSVERVSGIDLTTNQGWADANALSGTFNADDAPGSIATAGYGLQPANDSPVTTDAGGKAWAADLPLGLYLVTETQWSAGTTPSAPFLVAVPLTHPSGTSWLYDVTVYPKNSVDTVTKTVDDAGALAIGDPVSWTITGDIPNVATIDGYKITDRLDAKLDYAGAQVTLTDGTAITPGTDYAVAFDAATRTVSVTFTTAGRAVLAAHHAAQVQVVVATTVNAVGEIANTAVLYPNQHSFDVEPGKPGGPTDTPPVVTKWGAITVQKTDEKGRPLAGAVFSVYPSEQDAHAGTNAVVLDGATAFPVDRSGRLTLHGLRYSDFANGVTVGEGDPGYRAYWLAEIAAPSGYERLGEPVKFLVNAQTSTVGVDLKVANVHTTVAPPSGPPGVDILHHLLPNTGGPRLALFLGGGLLLLGGLVLVVASRRRDEA